MRFRTCTLHLLWPACVLPDREKHMPTSVTRPAHLLVIVAAIVWSSCGVFCRPRPFIASVSPSSVVAGGPQFFLTVTGSDFGFDSFVTWNGSVRPTTFISTHELIMLIAAGDIATPGIAQVQVFTPPGDGNTTAFIAPGVIVVNTSCGGGNSNVLTFTVSGTVGTRGALQILSARAGASVTESEAERMVNSHNCSVTSFVGSHAFHEDD
jgi:hypothetical protein